MKELTKLFEGADREELCREAEVGGTEGAMALTNAGVVYSKVQTAVVTARMWLSVPDDPRHDEARQILECAEKLKALAARDLPIYGTLEKLTALCDAGEAKITGPLVEHGKKMKGQRKGKSLPRTAAIDEALVALGPDASAEMVLRHIEATGDCRVEGDCIIWTIGKPAKISGFPNRVSERKKLLD